MYYVYQVAKFKGGRPWNEAIKTTSVGMGAVIKTYEMKAPRCITLGVIHK